MNEAVEARISTSAGGRGAVTARAVALTEEFLEQHRAELIQLASDDPATLRQAAAEVRDQSEGKNDSGTKHAAFGLLLSAHEELRRRKVRP